MAEEVVVAGAGFAGLNTALKLAGKGYDVTLIDKESFHEYKPGIINVLRDRVSDEKLKLDLHDFLENTSISFSREYILGIDPERKVVETNSGAHNYDYLVLSLGGQAATYGLDLSSIETCYSLDQALSIKESLEESDDAIVVGAGYVGVEIAGEISEKGVDVTLIDSSTGPTPHSNEECSRMVLNYLNSKDIAFRGGCKATEFTENSVELENGKVLEADTVIWAGGVQASEIVQKYFDTGPKGLKVNSGLASEEYENIFAAGDCADTSALKTAHSAMQQAETIAKNVPKGRGETLEEYSHGVNPLVISLGNTGVFHYGDFALKNKLVRNFKDLVRWRYWFVLKKEKLKARLF